jgi:hypothetical protein
MRRTDSILLFLDAIHRSNIILCTFSNASVLEVSLET